MTAHCAEAMMGARLLQGFGLSVGLWLVPILTAERKGVRMENLMEIAALIALVMTPLIGFFVGGYVAEGFGYRANFVILACLSFVVVYRIYTHFSPESFANKESLLQLLDRSKIIFRDRIVFYSMVLMGLQSALFFGYCGVAPMVMYARMSFTPSQFGVIGFFIVIPCVLGGFLSMQFYKDLTKTKLLRLGTFLILIGSLMLQGVFLMSMETTSLAGAVYWVVSSVFMWLGLGIIFLPTLKLSVGSLREHIQHRMPVLGITMWGVTMLGSLIISVLSYVDIEFFPLYFLIISVAMIVVQLRLLSNVHVVHASKMQ
jgi:MFS family permease